ILLCDTALNSESAGDRISFGKDGANAVAGAILNSSAAFADAGVDDRVVPRDGVRHMLLESFPALYAAFNIGEQVAHWHACRKLALVRRFDDDKSGVVEPGGRFDFREIVRAERLLRIVV